MITRRRALTLAAGIVAPALLTRTARAQAWPNRPVRVIVPFPAGGGGDTIARIVGAKLTEIWGQQIIIENRGGAGGNLASDATARSAPDGYTIFLSGDFLVTNQFVYSKLSYDPVADFIPITLVVRFPVVIVAPNSSPAQELPRVHRARKVEQQPADLCVAGLRDLATPCGRVAEARGGHRADARALSRRRARAPGPDPRPRRQLLQQYRADRSADAAGPDPRHRGHQRKACGGDAGPPHGRGVGPARLRRVGLVRLRGAGAHAAARSSRKSMPTPSRRSPIRQSAGSSRISRCSWKATRRPSSTTC